MAEPREVLISMRAEVGYGFDAIKRALWRMQSNIQITKVSAIYKVAHKHSSQTLPFFSFVVRAKTQLAAEVLSKFLMQIEAGSHVDGMSSPLKIKMLVYGFNVLATQTLCLPEPELHLRPDLLSAAVEVWPEYRHPVLGQLLSAMATAQDDSDFQIEYHSLGISLLDFSATGV